MAKKSNTKEFIKKSVAIHGGYYSYVRSKYVTAKIKVEIQCPLHGIFLQIPRKHVSGQGCPQCSIKKISEKLIKKSLLNRFEGIDQPDDFKIIPLSGKKFTKVDNEDFEKLKLICWTLRGDAMYAMNTRAGSMHRYILEIEDGKVVDHINGDGLDNRKSNLRICEHVNNMWNTKPQSGTSKYKGVCLDKKRNKWLAQITFNNINTLLGSFESEEEAAKVYDAKSVSLRGEYAFTYLNFPELKNEYLKLISNGS